MGLEEKAQERGRAPEDRLRGGGAKGGGGMKGAGGWNQSTGNERGTDERRETVSQK